MPTMAAQEPEIQVGMSCNIFTKPLLKSHEIKETIDNIILGLAWYALSPPSTYINHHVSFAERFVQSCVIPLLEKVPDSHYVHFFN